MTLHQGDPYSTHRRRTLTILALNFAAWLSLAASTVCFALNPTVTGLVALLASLILLVLVLYLFAKKLVPDWQSR
jgi:flagellar biosynthesis/type III secretory pathway M-ring protein FliF/YscJ